VVFGPGSIEQAHTAQEWVALDQVERATRFFVRLFESPN
jgi:acetylornithine deacetylase/succinyl-diaminopimelate desuccinylase-like protein